MFNSFSCIHTQIIQKYMQTDMFSTRQSLFVYRILHRSVNVLQRPFVSGGYRSQALVHDGHESTYLCNTEKQVQAAGRFDLGMQLLMTLHRPPPHQPAPSPSEPPHLLALLIGFPGQTWTFLLFLHIQRDCQTSVSSALLSLESQLSGLG